jgi:hypothetical protein
MLKRLDNDTLTSIVLNYNNFQSEDNSKKFGEAMCFLVDNIIKTMSFSLLNDFKNDIVYTCFERASNYSKEKGLAFNYFTTLILNQMRNKYRSREKKMNNEKKYGMFIVDSKE